ncbi:arf-GAP with Rho-GAP domain, ANK repeat and PH domain-containing protein 1 [Scomber japonicus]|uniref:arf-GAP with Rho-GAP domain, ANK repeat and PH domain-containing protein 1 n=1 Tax=Scomber japonicus TaxID=13676 RepID=UPI0023057E4E|nr:arf-GAP with Rho-GAP domain, ANK repeat and PH domain-containing protein 1 [Scomber japonicus]
MAPPPLTPPVPKPRSRYVKDNLSPASSVDRDLIGQTLPSCNGAHLTSDAPPLGDVFPSLPGIADIISVNIPSLADVAASISGSAPSAPSAPPSAPSDPSAPPSINTISDSISSHIPSLAGAAATLSPASPTSPVPAASLDSIFGSLANMPLLAGIVSDVANPAVSSTTTPSAPSPTGGKYRPPSLPIHTDVGALSQLVMSTLDQTSGVTLPPLEGAVDSAEEVLSPSPNTNKKENPYITVLACWENQEEADSESSNEEEDTGASPAPSAAERPIERDHPPSPSSDTSNIIFSQSERIIPTRPAPPPPRLAGQSGAPRKLAKQKTPRAATIRVSRKKGSKGSSAPQSAVVRSSWLDVWKGFRHNVLWATLDGQLMSLWKKRTDRLSEVVFHVSSITNVKKLDKRRFSIYFKKKHYDFMAHSDEVQEGWVTSLLACRGQPSPAPSELHGPITIKDPRSRGYAAVWGHDLWMYPSKESFSLGIASCSVPLNLASVRASGKHSFILTSPYRTFSLSVDSSKDLSVWLDGLSSSISSALSCSQVALRLWENPDNKLCGDCGSAQPEWASVNLLLVICHTCAGQHRALGSNRSKVRSLKMDSKVWTEPLVQLFVAYGNRLANQVWAPVVPVAEQLRPEASDEQRSKFIQDKYIRGLYRRVHPLTSSPSLMDQRLRKVVCGDDVEETMSLICSGAKVCQSDPQSPSPILLAERAGQALQTELLRLNQYIEVPPYLPQSANRSDDPAHSGEEEEELHGKLEEDRFLFSLENESAACDVLDLREVLSVFIQHQAAHQFEIVTLSDHLICVADDDEGLLSHMTHILKVILPGGVSYAEVGGASAVSKVCVVDVGGASSMSDVWLLLWEGGVSIHPPHRHTQGTLRMELNTICRHEMDLSENTITMATADRCVSLRLEEEHSCHTWFQHLQRALSNQGAAQHPPAANHRAAHQPLYPQLDVRSLVPPPVLTCISHINQHGLKVEGVYRRCGLATKVSQLVHALMTSPGSAPLQSDEQGVLDAAAALKQYVRQQEALFPERDRQAWLQAAVIPDERSRFSAYRRLLRKLPDNNRATLNALFGHFYMVQVFSQVNKMSAQNLAVVLLPSLFQSLNQDLLRLIREFIIHHTLLFLTPEEEEREGEEQITVF